MSDMTDADLAAIEARQAPYIDSDGDALCPHCKEYTDYTSMDIAALLVEVRRLQDELASAKRLADFCASVTCTVQPSKDAA